MISLILLLLLVVGCESSTCPEITDSNIRDLVNGYTDSSHACGDIGDWNTSRVTTLSETFRGARSFNGDLSNWDVSKVTSLYRTFYEAFWGFNGDLSNWDVSKVTSLYQTFGNARSFNGDLSNWDVSKVTSLEGTFDYATSFNGDCLLYTSPSPRDRTRSRMPSSA